MNSNGGFTKVPNALIKHTKLLGLSDIDMRVYTTVQMHARKGRNAYCSNRTVAKIIGVSERTIQKPSRKMQELGYLKRPKGGKNPYWDFNSLENILKQLSTPDHNSLIEAIQIRVFEYLTAKKSSQLKKIQPRNSGRLTPKNQVKKDPVTTKDSSPEVDKREVDIFKQTPEIDKDEEFFLNIWRSMTSKEKRKLDFEARQLAPFGSNVIFNGGENSQLNKLRVEALKLRETNDSLEPVHEDKKIQHR